MSLFVRSEGMDRVASRALQIGSSDGGNSSLRTLDRRDLSSWRTRIIADPVQYGIKFTVHIHKQLLCSIFFPF
jgi:hypothetical protein